MLFFIWLSNNLMLSVPLYTIFEMQDIYQSSRKLRKSLLLNNSDFCTDYWVLWSIIKAGLLYIHYSVKFRSYYSSAMLLQPRKILIYIQQNTDNIFAVLKFNIMTFYHKGQCSVLNGVMYLCCGPCNTHAIWRPVWQTLPLFLTQCDNNWLFEKQCNSNQSNRSNTSIWRPTVAFFTMKKIHIFRKLAWVRKMLYAIYIREMPHCSSKWDHFYQEKLSLSCQISSILRLKILVTLLQLLKCLPYPI